jgi:spermidine synthase
VRSLGATSLAVTTVLASFMAGLALGSLLFGKLIDKKGDPIQVYGLLELGIGTFAVLFPLVLLLLNPFYALIYPALQGEFYILSLVRFLLCFVVLLIPTILMGGTLPVLSKVMATGLSNLTEQVGRLYAVNTMGAVAGAFGTGFLLIPKLGIRQATWLCAILNFGILFVALAMSKRPAKAEGREGEETQLRMEKAKALPGRSKMILAVFAATGFCALAVEVIWTRILSLVIGTTVYAFAIMLTTFLLGLAAGSAVFARVAQRTRHPGKALGTVIAAIGLTVFLSTFAFGRLPVLYMIFYENAHPSWIDLTWIQFAFCSVIMLVPSFLMGSLFPLVTRLYARVPSKVGSEIGEIYAFNTVGAILGSVAGSFLFLRIFGAVNGLVLISMIYMAVGIILLAKVAEFRRRGIRLAAAVCTGAIAVALLANSPTIDRKMMTSGVYRYAPIYKTLEGFRRTLRQSKTLFYDEGLDATVTVERLRDEITLAIDGKVDASTGISDMTTQVLLAHLPLIFHPQPDTVLVIGLGSGVTLGSAQLHNVRWIDCVELLENVVEASRHFSLHNYDCLSDQRTDLIIGDARNHLLLTKSKYDVIISEPTNPWISGVGDLFTREFFRLAKDRLKTGGIMCAWFHTYHMGDSDMRTMVRTFVSVFPEAVLWMAQGTDLIFLGSAVPLTFDERLSERINDLAIAGDLARVWIHTPEDLVSSHVAGPRALLSFAGSREEYNTDDNMLLEFSAGRKVLEHTENIHLVNFLRMIEPPPLERFAISVADGIQTQMEARRKVMRGSLALTDKKTDVALSLYDQAYRLAPSDPYVLDNYIETNLSVGNVFFSRGEYDEAILSYRKALVEPEYPTSWLAYIGLGVCYLAKGDFDRALENTRLSIERNPYNAEGYHNLGKLQYGSGRIDEAVYSLEQALEIVPHAGAANDLSRIYMQIGRDPAVALDLANLATSLERKASYFNTLGWAYHSLGKYGEARRALRRALKLEPENSEAFFRLGMLELSTGRADEGREYLEKAVEFGHRDPYARRAEDKLRELR